MLLPKTVFDSIFSPLILCNSPLATTQPIFDAIRQYKQTHPTLPDHAYDMELLLYHPSPEQLTPPLSCIAPTTFQRFFLVLLRPSF